MTIEQANQYFAALPDGFASTEQLRTAFTAPVQKVQFVGVAGTAGKTVTARLLAAILHAQGIHAGLYHAGCRPLSERICIDDAPVDKGLLALTADALSAAEALPQDAAELAAAANCFGAAGCTLAVVELPDAGLAEALPGMPVCAVTSVGPDGVSRSVERLAALAAGVMRKDNADTIVGNMDSQIFLGGSEPTTLKDLAEALGKETIDSYNNSDTRGNSPSYGTNYQKLGHELMSRDELAVLDGGKCILQLRGVRPFLSDKYDLTQHPNYKYTSDYDPKNALDIEKFLNRKEKIHPDDTFIMVDADSLPPA